MSHLKKYPGSHFVLRIWRKLSSQVASRYVTLKIFSHRELLWAVGTCSWEQSLNFDSQILPYAGSFLGSICLLHSFLLPPLLPPLHHLHLLLLLPLPLRHPDLLFLNHQLLLHHSLLLISLLLLPPPKLYFHCSLRLAQPLTTPLLTPPLYRCSPRISIQYAYLLENYLPLGDQVRDFVVEHPDFRAQDLCSALPYLQ